MMQTTGSEARGLCYNILVGRMRALSRCRARGPGFRHQLASRPLNHNFSPENNRDLS
jgi:hypothetical protein